MTRADPPQQLPNLARLGFGTLPDGSASEMVTLSGDNGFEARIISYGAAIQSIFTADRAGRFADVVLGREDLASYVAERGFFGATIGRYANRFELCTNDAPNALHGGPLGFDRRNWTITAIGEDPAPFVTLTYLSPDGEEGYPGRLQASVTYRVSGGTELSVAFTAVTDRPTVVNLTNHSFFNLEGVEAGEGILDHDLTIAADTYLPVRADGIPLGGPAAVEGTPFDFRSRHRVGARLGDADPQIQLRQGYDHCYCLRGGAVSEPRFAARVEAPRAGRALELWTNQPGIQFYSGNFLDGTMTGKYHRLHRQYDALCLEPQLYPDSPNRPDFPSARLDPGQTYRHLMLYRFSTM
jgi:aldose 1-epimerase